MPCVFNPFPLEINSNGGLKWEHLEFSSSVTKIIIIISLLPQCLLTMRGSHPLNHLTFWSRGLVRSRDKLNSLILHYHSITMTTKLGRMVAHLDGLLPIKSHDSLMTWSCDITWQAKTIISPLRQSLWPRNLEGCCLIFKGF